MKRPLHPAPRTTAVLAIGFALAAPLAHADATRPEKGGHGKGTPEAPRPQPPKYPMPHLGGTMPAPLPPSKTTPLPRALLHLHPHGPDEPCYPIARKA